MIHHISIPAKDPRHVAHVLAEILQGVVMPFPPLAGAYAVIAQDDYGTLIEVYPSGSKILPGDGDEQASFYKAASADHFTAIHAAISVPINQEQIEAIAQREGWRTLACNRDGLFSLIELWVENRLMLELLPPTMVNGYLQALSPASLRNLMEQFAAVPARG